MASAQSAEDSRAKRGGHRLFDHTLFPDAVILRVRTHNFVVSASYLALHSPFFHKLFYGKKAKSLNGRYELDYDPHTFGDLLDTIYPCYKKTKCCVDCSSSLEDRLNLALELKLRYAVKRFIHDNPKSDSVIQVLQENNAWRSYLHLLSNKKPMDDVSVKRDLNDTLEPLIATAKFPDAVSLIVGGEVSFLVSASTLSLHSPLLSNRLYENGQLVKKSHIDIGTKSFGLFSQAMVSKVPTDYKAEFLDDLIHLGAQPLYDYCLADIMKKIHLRTEDGPRCAMLLLEHYVNQEMFCRVKYIGRYLSRANLESVLDKCFLAGSITDSQKEKLLKSYDEFTAANQHFQLFVKSLTGRTLTFNCCDAMTVAELKLFIEDKEGIPSDLQVLIWSGKQLEAERTMKEYGIEKETSIHLVLKLSGC